MKGLIGSVSGMRLVEVSEDVSMVSFRRQHRFPRSKRTRIQKKWSKQDKNYCTGKERHTFVSGDTIYADALTIEKIKALQDKK
jgi:hypothetical protein